MNLQAWLYDRLNHFWQSFKEGMKNIEKTIRLSHLIFQEDAYSISRISTFVMPVIDDLEKFPKLREFPHGLLIKLSEHNPIKVISLALQWIAKAQKENILCAWIDLAHGFDRKEAVTLKLDLDLLLFSQPTSFIQMLEIAKTLVQNTHEALIIVDLTDFILVEPNFLELYSQKSSRLHNTLLNLRTMTHHSSCTIVFLETLPLKNQIYDGTCIRFYVDLQLGAF